MIDTGTYQSNIFSRTIICALEKCHQHGIGNMQLVELN